MCLASALASGATDDPAVSKFSVRNLSGGFIGLWWIDHRGRQLVAQSAVAVRHTSSVEINSFRGHRFVIRRLRRKARLADVPYEPRATDAVLEAKGKAKEVKKRQQNRKSSVDTRKRKKAKVEDLVQEEARLMERAAGLLADLERGGSTVLDDDGAGAFPEDEERIKALDAAKIREQDEKKKKNLGGQWTRARQALARKVLQRRVVLLENRVAELEKELRARAAA